MKSLGKRNERKDEILNKAGYLFLEKGFDATSIQDILDAVGIAKGTLYHYFKSKEDIMDTLIASKTDLIIEEVKMIAYDESVSVHERFVKAVAALNIKEKDDNKAMVAHINNPQNALMHQKINKVLLNEVPKIFSKIIEDGVNNGIFNTPYPLESMEIAVIYLETIMDRDIFELSPSELKQKIDVFFYNFERIMGINSGELNYVKDLLLANLK